jgi:hypothetical protein
MTRFASAVALVGLLGAVTSAADDPPKPPGQKAAGPEQSLEDQIVAIKRDYQEQEKRFRDERRAAGGDQKKVSEASGRFLENTGVAADKLKAIIRQAGKEPAAFEGVLVLIGQMRYDLDDELAQLVLRDHLAHAKMGELCFALRYRSGEASVESILKEAAARHPQAAVRGQALYALGDYHLNSVPFTGQRLAEAEEAKKLGEAGRYYAAVVKDYAAYSTPNGRATLGAKAAVELTRLKNIPNLKVGKLAPDIEGEDIDGVKFKLSDYRGKVVLLDFWGHW